MVHFLLYYLCKKKLMKTSTKTILGVVAFAVTAALVYLTRSFNTTRRLTHISNEGYETADDILYPAKHNRAKKLHYGPVLPVDDSMEEKLLRQRKHS